MKNLAQVDNRDFTILSIVGNIITTTGHQQVSSWDVCQALFPKKKNPQNHLSSVIWRLDKLVGLHFLKEHPHPTRDGKKVYSLPDYAFSVDGTVFIPSPIGGVIVNCKYKGECNPCTFGDKNCLLAQAILKDGLEPVLKIAERLSKLNNTKKEDLTQIESKRSSSQVPQLNTIQA